MGLMFSKIKRKKEKCDVLMPAKPALNFERKDTVKIKNKLALAKNRLNNFITKGFKATSWIIWVVGVSVVVLITPIAFQYEKECQLFEMQAQFFQAQQAANVPQLN